MGILLERDSLLFGCLSAPKNGLHRRGIRVRDTRPPGRDALGSLERERGVASGALPEGTGADSPMAACAAQAPSRPSAEESAEETDSSSSTASSSSGLAKAEAALVRRRPSKPARGLAAGYAVHPRSRVVHCVSASDRGRSACGRSLGLSHAFVAKAEGAGAKCLVCFGGKSRPDSAAA
jgi:hypothetical protein